MSERIKRKLIGNVVSDKMKNTVIVRIKTIKVHPKYKKRYNVFKKFVAHNEITDIKIGDLVEIEEMKPKSKTKHWLVLKKI
ncbi:MAG: 30S ribosomal protein S17 [bacterium]|nr:30S ribosomal protein S17 [bacterium]